MVDCLCEYRIHAPLIISSHGKPMLIPPNPLYLSDSVLIPQCSQHLGKGSSFIKNIKLISHLYSVS